MHRAEDPEQPESIRMLAATNLHPQLLQFATPWVLMSWRLLGAFAIEGQLAHLGLQEAARPTLPGRHCRTHVERGLLQPNVLHMTPQKEF